MAENFITNWTKPEFKAYLLLYCANADFIESTEEKEFIRRQVDEETFDKIHKEFDADNDYQSIQKIMLTAKRYNYSQDQINSLLEDIKKLFFSDGNFGTLERNLLVGLKRLL